MFQGSLKGVSRKFKGCFKDASRVFLRKFKLCFKDVSVVLQGSLKGVSRMFQGCFKGVSRKSKACFKETYRKSLKESLFCCCRRSFLSRRRACFLRASQSYLTNLT